MRELSFGKTGDKNSDVARFTTLVTCYKPSLLRDRFGVGGKKRNIAIQLILQQFTRQVARFFVAQFIVPLVTCVLLLYEEGPRDLQNLFAITRFRYVEVLFHIFYYCWVKNIVYFTEDFVT